MIDAIIYSSKSGHTKEYAFELARKLSLPVYSLKQAKRKLPKKSSIIYMGWINQNKVVGFEQMTMYKVIATIGVGICPKSEEAISRIKLETVLYGPFFYLRGGIRPRKQGLKNRLTLKYIVSELQFKISEGRATYEEKEIVDAVVKRANLINFELLDEIIEWVNINYKEDGILS